MVAKDRSNATVSPNPKAEVGEIDTRAPFQSVKDAVSLFGEGAFSGERPAIRKPKPYSAERVLAKQTQLHLIQKELTKLREQLKSAEITKSQALSELEKVKITAEDLRNKLSVLTESKEAAIMASEAAKSQAKQGGESSWAQDLEAARAQYTSAITELDAAKQELRKIRLESDVSLEAKVAAFKQEAEAKDAKKANTDRVGELSKEIASAKESIEQVKLLAVQSQHEQAKIFTGKDEQRKSHKSALEDSARKLALLKSEFDPDLSKKLKAELAETLKEIEATQKRMESEKASDLESVKTVTLELDDAKGSLQKVVEEESSLRSSVEALKLEIENVKKEHAELKEKEAETESIAGNLHIKLQKTKSDLEACLAEEHRARGACDEMISTVTQLSQETETANREAEETKTKAEELKNEVEATKLAVREAEIQLRIALEEAEEAKSGEEKAVGQIKALLEETNAVRTSISESGANITISRDEFESLSHKVEESERLAEMKVAAAVAQAAAVKAGENEALQRLEALRKEIDETNAATEAAAKRAEMAGAAKKAVEGELKRWRERDLKKAADAASRILAETESSSPKPKSPAKAVEARKLEKEKSSVSKKTLLPNLSGIFNRKKNQIEGGSPSYLPGERPL